MGSAMSDEKPKNVIKPIGMTMVPFKDTPEGEVAALRMEVARLEKIVKKYELMFGGMPDALLDENSTPLEISRARNIMMRGGAATQIRTPTDEPTQ